MVATGEREDTNFPFYYLDLGTAASSTAGVIDRGASEDSSAAYYAPYITGVSADGGSVLRLGFEAVTQGTGPGLGVVALGVGGGPNASFWEEVPAAPGYEFMYSMARFPGTDLVYSLAPAASGDHSLSVVAWSGTAGEASLLGVVMEMGNAHPPGTNLVGTLGYVADTASGDM